MPCYQEICLWIISEKWWKLCHFFLKSISRLFWPQFSLFSGFQLDYKTKGGSNQFGGLKFQIHVPKTGKFGLSRVKTSSSSTKRSSRMTETFLCQVLYQNKSSGWPCSWEDWFILLILVIEKVSSPRFMHLSHVSI